MSNTKMFP